VTADLLTLDEAALVEAWDMYHFKIYRYLLHMSCDQWLAEDLASQTFLKAIEAIAKGHTIDSSLSGYLFRIARNLYYDHYRHALKAGLTVEYDAQAEWLLVPDDELERAETGEEMRRLLGRAHLTATQYEAVIRYWIQGYTAAELAEWWDTSEGAVKSLLHRAKMRMQRATAR